MKLLQFVSYRPLIITTIFAEIGSCNCKMLVDV